LKVEVPSAQSFSAVRRKLGAARKRTGASLRHHTQFSPLVSYSSSSQSNAVHQILSFETAIWILHAINTSPSSPRLLCSPILPSLTSLDDVDPSFFENTHTTQLLHPHPPNSSVSVDVSPFVFSFATLPVLHHHVPCHNFYFLLFARQVQHRVLFTICFSSVIFCFTTRSPSLRKACILSHDTSAETPSTAPYSAVFYAFCLHIRYFARLNRRRL